MFFLGSPIELLLCCLRIAKYCLRMMLVEIVELRIFLEKHLFYRCFLNYFFGSILFSLKFFIKYNQIESFMCFPQEMERFVR